MDKRKLLAVVMSGITYSQKIKNLFGSSLIGYWPMDEASGTIAYDKSGNARNGTYANVTLGQPGIGDGKTSPLFGAAQSRNSVYSAGLLAASDWTEYGISIWVKMLNVGVWTDGVLRRAINLVHGNDTISIYKVDSPNNQFTLATYIGGVQKATIFGALTTIDWFNIGFTGSQSNNRVIHYYNGVPSTTALTFNAALSPSDGMVIGSRYVWDQNTSGYIAHVAFTNREMTGAEMMRAATIGYKPIAMLFLGNSITASTLLSFPKLIWQGYSRRAGYINRGVGGSTIMAGAAPMSTQVTASASDNADVIILEFGTNDADDAGITAEYQAQIVALQASNPAARIYGLGILPRSSDNVAVNNPRIHTACTNAGVTYWDPVGWIDPATDTSDGVHPTAAGHAKIATQILALLP
jgi:lysophospholipase L1-like esterase